MRIGVMRNILLVVLVALPLLPRPAKAQGNPVGPEFRVNSYTTNAQTYSSVAADSSGNFVVVWNTVGVDGSVSSIAGQRFSGAGVPLGPEFRVNTYTTGHQYFAAVGANSSGSFVVAWNSDGQDGSGDGIFAQRYATSGAPIGPEFRVNTSTTGNQKWASVAVADSGDFVVVWQGYDGSEYGVFGQRYASSGAPLGPEFRVNTFTPFDQSIPVVAADSAGNFVVVWTSSYQAGYGPAAVFGQRYAASGAPLGLEFRVSGAATGVVHALPSVRSDPQGDFVVVWLTQPILSNADVFGQRYASSGAPLGTAFRANTFTSGSQFRADVALDALGNFVVVWESNGQDGSVTGVYGQRYSSTGIPLGPEFRVNTYTTGYQRRASVAADALGRFVVVWDDNVQEYFSPSTFAQRYAPILPVELMHFGIE